MDSITRTKTMYKFTGIDTSTNECKEVEFLIHAPSDLTPFALRNYLIGAYGDTVILNPDGPVKVIEIEMLSDT